MNGSNSQAVSDGLAGSVAVSKLGEELRMLTVKELQMRAEAQGVDKDAIEDTLKESLIELILAMSPGKEEKTTWPAD